MEKGLQEYIERIKATTIDTKDVKRGIIRIKKYLDEMFGFCDEDINDGEITKSEIVENFLEDYRKQNKEDRGFQSTITYTIFQYEACKRIFKLAKKDRDTLNMYINRAKRLEKDSHNETLYYTINTEEGILLNLRGAIRTIKRKRMAQKREDSSVITFEEILGEVYSSKEKVSEKLKSSLISALQRKIRFLNEYGYMDEFIKANNESLGKIGLSEIEQLKRNPVSGFMYDAEGNEVPIEEVEDIGVIDAFDSDNLQKLSPEELYVLELYWKSKYFAARLENLEALNTIEYLDLWPMIIEQDESAIENLDLEKINQALKRDLALTYLIKVKKDITPELEDRYLQFLEKNGMTPKGSTIQEVEEQSKELDDVVSIADSIMLGSSVVVDLLRSREIEVKNWGIVPKEELGEVEEGKSSALAIEMPNFRGTLLMSIDEQNANEFFMAKNRDPRKKVEKLPRFRGVLNEEYSKAMASLFLPTSTFFKKYIAHKYSENPSSPLLASLAINYAGSKKIKNKNAGELEDK